jgi:hypothetical protein
MKEQISIYKDNNYIKSYVVEEQTLLHHNLEQIIKPDVLVSEWLEIIHYYLTHNTFCLRFKYSKKGFIDTVKLYEFLLSCDKEDTITID